MTISRLSSFVLVGVLATATSAHAQSRAAEAEQLFRDGKRLMGEKKYGEACAAFDASYKLDPLSTTLLNLADCREKNAQYASAWGAFLEAERMTRANAKDAPLNNTAKDRAAKLEPRLSFLIINVPDESRVEGLLISRNGVSVERASWNRAIPVDGGEYVIEGKAPGHEPWSTRVTLKAEQDKQSVDVPKFKALPIEVKEEPAPGGGVVGGGGTDGGMIEGGGGGGGGLGGKRIAAIGLGVVGVAGLVTGGVFELQARGTYDDAKAEPDDDRQDELWNDANGQRTIGMVSAIVGVACVGTAAFLWFTGGSSEESPDPTALRWSPSIGGDSVGVTFSGGF